MRILRLDLLAFGPFTGRSLDFGDGAGLSIVHGPNEAGKSSSLRALRNLLYGIPQQSADAFVHAYANLRIGGLFEAADGTRLACIRRKGRTNTLRGPDDVEVCDEGQLRRLLGGVDATAYAQRFGIDYQELRRGGEAIVQGGGDLGEILFAAGAGVANVARIQQQFAAEAEALFKPKGALQPIGRSLAELDRLRKEIREAQLSTSQWNEHDREVRRAESRQREIDEELTRRRSERHRLDRIGKSLPLTGRRKQLREALAEVATAPVLRAGFQADRLQAEAALETAQRDETKARQEIERLEVELRSISVPAGLLEHRSAISQAHAELGSSLKAAQDRPGLVARRAAALQAADALRRELSQPTTREQAAALKLPKRDRRRIQELAGDCKALMEQQAAGQQALRELDEDIRRVDERIARLPRRRSLAELERTVREVQKCGDLDGQWNSEQAEVERLDAQARIERARLTQYAGTLEELETLPIPSAETVDRFEQLLADAEAELRRWQEKADECRTARHELQAGLDALRMAGEAPTEAELESLRQRRDAGWDLVVRRGLGEVGAADPAVTGFVAEFAAGGDLYAAFRASLERADAVADRLRREADRVAQQAKLTADLQQAELRLKTHLDRGAAAAELREQLLGEWQASWRRSGIEPLTPREMRSWRNRQQELAGLVASRRNRAAERDRLTRRIDALRGELNQCLAAAEQPAVADQEPLSGALARCEGVVAAIREENQRRDRLEQERERLHGQRPSVEHAAREARERLDQWRTEWKAAVTILRLDGQATPAEAIAVIETIDELLGLLDESESLSERIDGIDEDAARFRQSVRALLQQVAPDLLETLELAVDRAVNDLVDRLGRAIEDQAKLNGYRTQLQSQTADRDSAAADAARWREALAALCVQAGRKAPEELPQAEQRSETRRELERELQDVEQRLCELAAGASLEEWLAVAGPFDADQISAELKRLDDAIRELERDKQRESETLGEHRNELARMNGGDKAAEARIQLECLLASLRRDAEEYARKRLAATVLAEAIERFRASSQGPVLSRASELFAALTCGSFAGLRADADDKGEAVLVGVRPCGQTVGVAGMSEGTCDQIYLALRIALLESSLRGREPLPFIVDDILIMFDDRRTAAALRMLAQFAQTTQVVLFTHHEHLVRIASDALGDDALRIVEFA